MFEESLICAYLLDGKGHGRRLDWRSVADWTPEEGLLWVHLDYSTIESEAVLQRRFDLPAVVAETLLLDEPRPRSEPVNQGLLLVLRGVNLNPGADPEDMVSLRLWIEPGRIITTRHRRLMSIDSLRASIEEDKAPRDAGEFILSIIDRLETRIADVVDGMEEEVDNIETVMTERTADHQELRLHIADLRRQSAHIRRFLAPQRDALERLGWDAASYLGDRMIQQLRGQADHMRRHVEDLDLARERTLVLQEQLMVQLAEEQNRRMYVLSVVAAIFLPLTFVTGLLGMNVGGIPGEGRPAAFVLLVGGMVLIAIGLFMLFRWRKWI